MRSLFFVIILFNVRSIGMLACRDARTLEKLTEMSLKRCEAAQEGEFLERHGSAKRGAARIITKIVK